MSCVASALGEAPEARAPGDADEPADVPAVVPAEARADDEGAAVLADEGPVVTVTLPQPATTAPARMVPSSVRTVELKLRNIRIPRANRRPRPFGDFGRLIHSSMESRPGACQTA
jgi:hypothetical protein